MGSKFSRCLSCGCHAEIEAAGQEVSKAEAERVALLRSIEEEHAINTRLKAQGEESQRKDKEELKAMDAEVNIVIYAPVGLVFEKRVFLLTVFVCTGQARA
jgi:hypothetical protein